MAKGMEGKALMEALDAEASKSCGDTHKMPRISLIDKKRGLTKGSDNEYD